MNVTAVSKDVHWNISRAIWLIGQAEIRYVEPSHWTNDVPICDISNDQLREVKRILADHDICVSMLATAFGTRDGIEKWDRSIEIALALETKHLRISPFGRAKRPYPEAVEETRKACEAAKAQRLIVTMMNGSPQTYACAAGEIKTFLTDVGVDNLRLCWDPGNHFYFNAGKEDTVATAHAVALDLTDYVHVKDIAAGPEKRFVRLGAGAIDYAAIFRTLATKGYTGFYALEPHYGAGDLRVLKENLTALRALLREARHTALAS